MANDANETVNSGTHWRPKAFIKVKVIALIWRDDQLLCAKINDDRGKLIGVRPPGGSVKFGETIDQALRREIHEELATDVTKTGTWQAYENIFCHEGAQGHEYIFAANAQVQIDSPILTGKNLRIVEASGSTAELDWFSLRTLVNKSVEVFPNGLSLDLEQFYRSK